MSKLLKVRLEYDDKICEIEGAELEKWERHNKALVILAHIHGMNPFNSEPINWIVAQKNREVGR